MKTSIQISLLVSIIFFTSNTSANELDLLNEQHSLRTSNNAQELWSAHSASKLIVSNFHLAMMDEMEEMKMKKKGGMGNMSGNMPPDDAMSTVDSPNSMQDTMAATPNSCMMGCMGESMQKPSMKKLTPNSQLPGFPGASHLYHIGSTGFFLDHPQHIALSIQQQSALNRLKEKALLDRANFNRRIQDSEQMLWTLTAADTPDASKIDSKVRSIEKLRGDQRLAFIRAVGEAGKVLTSNQRESLLGTMSSTAKMPAPANSTSSMPSPMTEPAPMSDM